MTHVQVQMEIRYLPIDQLREAPYNPRRELPPSSPAYRRLRRSLLSFGLVEPLIWNENTGYVVGGHFRLRILKELGVQLVPVSVVRLSPEREKALNVVLNNAEAQGQFDRRRLLRLLRELEPLAEMELTGFTSQTLRELEWQPQPLELVTVATSPDAVELTVQIPRAVWDQVAPEIDKLVQRYDLRCHVRFPEG
ncbi:MAG: ParB N-terminal domain-containing protein [Gemmataceae bacterium]|nr:ParB N-terminal domain-containing protein [Gemmataceae bacterium]MCS7269845.1 ParB N-terminal domain-containing protein [Gemmataceae bacterium]MDW8243319.1 ParB N-terminal domain-containing protein [Thermogemmata sp.]